MKRIIALFLIASLRAFAADAANDLILTQRKADNSGNIQRNLAPTASGLFGFDAGKLPTSLSLGANVATFLATPSSANLAAAITDETGTGPAVFATAPSFTNAITVPTLLNLTSTSATTTGGIAFGAGETTYFRLASGVHAFKTTTVGLQATLKLVTSDDSFCLVGRSNGNSQIIGGDQAGDMVISGNRVLFSSNGLSLTLDASMNATFAGNILRFVSTKGIQGSNTNDDVAAGYTGEYVSTLKAIGSPVSLSNNTVADIISVTLTAGDWDVTGLASVTETTSTVTARTAGLTSTSVTLPTDGSEGYNGVQSVVTSETNSIPLNRKRFSLSTTTTIYLDEKVTFSAGTAGGFGSINARRIR